MAMRTEMTHAIEPPKPVEAPKPSRSRRAVAADEPSDADRRAGLSRRNRRRASPPRAGGSAEAADERRAPSARHDRRGYRRHQGAADGPSDRAAAAAHPRALRVFRRLPRLLLFFALDLQHPDLALCAGGRGGKGDADRDAFPRAVLHQHQAFDVRRRRHRVSGHRDADLPFRRARPLQAREAGVPALSDRDAVVLSRWARCWSISS